MDALLSRIYEQPADLQARLVYADQLVERGDPYGEFIQLQLLGRRSPIQAARMEGLLVRHRDAWLSPLGSVLVPDSVRFRHGFPVSGRFRRRAASQSVRNLVGHPAWATLECLDIRGALFAGSDLVGDPVLRSLRELVGLPAHRLKDLWSSAAPRPLESLGVQLFKELSPLHELAQATTLPRLRTLDLYTVHVEPHQLRPLWDGPVGQRLERLILHSLRGLPNWVAEMNDLPVDVVELCGQRWRILVHRPDRDLAPDLHAHFDPRQPAPERSPMLLLARILEPIGGIIGHLTVTAPDSFTPPSSYVRRVMRSIEAPATLPEHWWLRI